MKISLALVARGPLQLIQPCRTSHKPTALDDYEHSPSPLRLAGRCLAVPAPVTVDAIYNIPSKRRNGDWSVVYGKLYEKLVGIALRVLPQRRDFEESIVP